MLYVVLGSGATKYVFILTGMGGNAEVELAHAVYGCRNGCMCLVYDNKSQLLHQVGTSHHVLM
jgi:hypothetical protein